MNPLIQYKCLCCPKLIEWKGKCFNCMNEARELYEQIARDAAEDTRREASLSRN